MNSDENEAIEVRVGRVWLGTDGILRFYIDLPHAEVTLEDAQEAVAAYHAASRGKKRPLLTDARNVKSTDRPARVYSASEAVGSVASAVAILIDSPLGKVLGNFFMRVSKPRYPSRLFTSEEEAMNWLKSYLD